MPYGPGVALSRTPTNPTALASASLLMAGLGVQTAACRIVAGGTGRLVVMITGDLVADANGRTSATQISYGTGTAPANAAAVAGTQTGGSLAWVSLTAQLTRPFAISTLITGLTAGTDYWLDLAGSSSAGTIQYTNLNLLAFEV